MQLYKQSADKWPFNHPNMEKTTFLAANSNERQSIATRKNDVYCIESNVYVARRNEWYTFFLSIFTARRVESSSGL